MPNWAVGARLGARSISDRGSRTAPTDTSNISVGARLGARSSPNRGSRTAPTDTSNISVGARLGARSSPNRCPRIIHPYRIPQWILPDIFHDARPQRVRHDISRNPDEILFTTDRPVHVASLPDRLRPKTVCSDASGRIRLHAADTYRQALRLPQLHQPVHVIRHYDECQRPADVLVLEPLQRSHDFSAAGQICEDAAPARCAGDDVIVLPGF